MRLCQHCFTNSSENGEKLKKILSPACFLKLKNIILLLNRGLIFFWNGHIHNVVSTLPNVLKIDIENDNVFSTLSNVVQFNVEIDNVVSTLLDVANFKVDIRNAVPTLIWRCATSRSHINLKATLNRRWNVCWEGWIFFCWKTFSNLQCLQKTIWGFFNLVYILNYLLKLKKMWFLHTYKNQGFYFFLNDSISKQNEKKSEYVFADILNSFLVKACHRLQTFRQITWFFGNIGDLSYKSKS